MCRSAVAASFPLFTVQMYTQVHHVRIESDELSYTNEFFFVQLGINWASTLMACIGLLLTPSPFLFYKYGARIRRGSTFAPCTDLKIAKELKAEGQEKLSPI